MAYLSAQLSGFRHACRFVAGRLFPHASYADDEEDRMLWELLGGVRSFLDVGANDGISSSNTALAAFRGARGICFEPNRAVFVRLKWFYRWSRRIECVAQGLSETNGTLALRCDGLLSSMPSTEDTELSLLLSPFKDQDAQLAQVQVSRLSDWFVKRPEFIGCDLLSIDVEGHELSVLRGIDWGAHPKPGRALVLETHATKDGVEVWRHQHYDAISDLLDRNAYVKVASTRNNTIWLHSADAAVGLTAGMKSRFPRAKWFIHEHARTA